MSIKPSAQLKPLLIFWIVLLAAAAAALTQAHWGYIAIITQSAPELSWDAFLFNWARAIQGKGTAAEAARGALIFLGMSGCFWAAGTILLRKILGPAQGGPETSPWESRAVSWLAGSWILSTLWFALGTAGLFHPFIAWLLVLGGLGYLIYTLYSKWPGLGTLLKQAPHEWTAQEIVEKILILGLISWILIYAAFVAFPQYYWDTLSLNMAVPGYYAAEGRFVPNPYHVYTYFAQHYELLCAWALLAGSKEAAFFLTWAHWAALLAFAYGFLSRSTSRIIALIAIGLFLSSYLSSWLAFHIKNDLQVGLFLILQWWALRFALDGNRSPQSRWLFLAGFFAGAAYAVKFIAVPPILVTLCGLALFFAIHSETGSPRWKQVHAKLGLFAAGGLLSAGPWLARNAILFKNPFYPFLNGLFGAEYIEPWHHHPLTSYRLLTTGWRGLTEYAKDFSQIHASGPFAEVPVWWGPTAVLCVAGLLCFTRRANRADRWLAGVALVSWFFCLFFALKPITHVGPIVYACVISFGLGFSILWKNAGRPWIKVLTAAVALGGLAQGWIHSGTKSQGYIAVKLLAGSAPLWHWIPSLQTDTQSLASINEMEMIHEFINKHVPKEDVVLYVGSVRPAGIQRRHIAAMGFAKQPLLDFAEQSADETDLRDRLIRKGVRHIVLDLGGWESWLKGEMVDDPHRHGIPIADQDVRKINAFFARYAVARAASYSGKLSWFSVRANDNESFTPVVPDEDDLYRQPVLYTNLGVVCANSGRADEAWGIFRALDQLVFPPHVEAAVDHCLKVMASGE